VPHTNYRHAPNCLVIQLQHSTPRSLRATSVHFTSLVSKLTQLSFLFLRLATSGFLSFLTVVRHLLHFRFPQQCFCGFIASWMRVFVDKWAVTDFSKDRSAAFSRVNPLNPKLNPICYLLALLAHHFLHVSGIRVKFLTFRPLMSYICSTHSWCF